MCIRDRTHTVPGFLRPYKEARSNACAIWSTRQSPRCGPTIWSPTGRPRVVKPAGTEIAGHAVSDRYQHERIQSMYVGIGTPATLVGYSVVTSNGSTWVTGAMK